MFLEGLAADSCRWDYLHSRMQINMLAWGDHVNLLACFHLGRIISFLMHSFPIIHFDSAIHFYNIISKATLISLILHKNKRMWSNWLLKLDYWGDLSSNLDRTDIKLNWQQFSSPIVLLGRWVNNSILPIAWASPSVLLWFVENNVIEHRSSL